jgi:hypothetical protein
MAISNLNRDWVTEGTLDVEYKKYLLLAYLQFVQQNFAEKKLYPPLSELIEHFRHLELLRKGVESLEDRFPKNVSGIDLKRARLIFEQVSQKDASILNLCEIIDFALQSMMKPLENGKDIFDWVEQHLKVETVGLEPFYKSEGYMMIYTDGHTEIPVYRYQVSSLSYSDERYKGMSLQYIATEQKSITNSFEQIKLNLIRQWKDLPNPATYLFLSDYPLPFQETLLPVSKRILMRMVST